MNREILFRGLNSKGEWNYGGIAKIPYKDDYRVVITSTHWTEGNEDEERLITIKVKENTIGQFTGLQDKFGVKLFEGDIIKIKIVPLIYEDSYDFVSVVKWQTTHGMFGFTTKHGWLSFSHDHFIDFEILGNVFEKPELLK